MAASDNLGGQFAPIHRSDLPDLPTAHASSKPVSHDEFQAQAARGQSRLDKMRSNKQDTSAMHAPDTWNAMVDHAYQATREPWGGATYNPRTASAVDFHRPDKFALTVREPNESPISVHPAANRQQFGAAMEQARAEYGTRLTGQNHYLGAFHDADAGRIDLDPTVVVGDPSRKHRMHKGLEASQEIMAATHALGGAYHFASGDGFWPNHVSDGGK